VETIGVQAFYNCTALTEIINLRTIPVSIISSSNVFYNVKPATCELKVSKTSCDLYADADVWKNYLRDCDNDRVSVAVVVINPLHGWVSGVESRFYQLNDQLELVGHPMPGFKLMSWTSEDVQIAASDTLRLTVTQDTLIYVMFGVEAIVETCAAGTFRNELRAIADPSVVSHLTVKCTIDARDVKYMRDSIPNLNYLDLSEATIVYYNFETHCCRWRLPSWE
jgi:hypothetical protein